MMEEIERECMSNPSQINKETERSLQLDNVSDMADNHHDTACGIGSFRPRVLSKFGNITAFTVVLSGISLLTQSLWSYLSSQAPTLEKHFGLSSFQIGILLSCNDIGFLVAIILVSSLARLINIPRWLFICVLLFGSSCILCCTPNFIRNMDGILPVLSEDGKTNKTKSNDIPLCIPEFENGSTEIFNCEKGQRLSKGVGFPDYSIQIIALVLIGGGMFLQGFTKAPRGPFVTVYVDDSIDRRKTGFYIGIMTGSAVFGPALAYGFGGLCNTLYVTLKDVDISPRDPRWIGAWWLGFLVFGVASFVFALPVLCFPRRLKLSGGQLNRKKQQRINEENSNLLSLKVLKECALSYWRVLKSTNYLIIVSSNLFHLISITAFTSFVIKYMETQFGLPVWKVNIIFGIVTLITLCAGTITGGTLTRKFRMTPKRCYSLLTIIYILQALIFSFGYFLGCEQPAVVGPDSSVRGVSLIPNNCSSVCACDEIDFFPICGSDGVSYYSPCFAGCSEYSKSTGHFINCTCIPNGKAISGLCDFGCNSVFYAWIAVRILSAFVGGISVVVAYITTIRCVDNKDKSTAIGLQSFLFSLFAFIPVPIIFGKITDTSCLIWQTSCSIRGACVHYDIVDYRIKFHTFGLAFKLLSVFMGCLGYWRVRYWKDWPQNQEINENMKEQKEQIRLLSKKEFLEKKI